MNVANQRTPSGQPMASLDDWQLYWRENRNNILTVVLAFFVLYLGIYSLLMRNSETSLISPYVVYIFLGFLLAMIVYLQLSKYVENRQETYEPVRPDQRYQMFLNEARREHLINNLKRGQEQKAREEPSLPARATPQFTRLSPYTNPVQQLGTVVGRYEGTTMLGLGEKRELPSRYWNPLRLQQQPETAAPMMLPGATGEPSRRLPSASPRKSAYPPTYQSDLNDYELQMNNSQAEKLYELLGIKSQIPLWVENLKNWMAGRFIPMLLDRHNDNIDKLNKVLYDYGRKLVFQECDNLYSTTPRPILWEELCDVVMNNRAAFDSYFPSPMLSGYNYTPSGSDQRKADLRELVKERMDIERYLRVKDGTLEKREYVIGRLKELAKDFMEEYSNNGGGSFRGEPWSPAFPRDSDVSFCG